MTRRRHTRKFALVLSIRSRSPGNGRRHLRNTGSGFSIGLPLSLLPLALALALAGRGEVLIGQRPPQLPRRAVPRPRGCLGRGEAAKVLQPLSIREEGGHHL